MESARKFAVWLGVAERLRLRAATLRPSALPRPPRSWPAVALGVIGALLAWRSWNAWTDPLVDFGRELYVAWRLSEGDVLYLDVGYFNGPLSPAVNAAWLKLFGPGVRTLALANLAILAAIVAFAYWLVRQTSSRRATATALAAFLALFAFSSFTLTRNYNYVTPYSHEMTHGLLLGLAALAAATRVEPYGAKASAVAGIFVGLALLTKPELALGSIVAALAMTGIGAWQATGRLRTIAWSWFILVACAAVAPLAAIAWSARWMPASEAAANVFAAWRMAATPEIRELPFYQRGLGTLDLELSLNELAVSTSRWAILAGAAAGLAHAGRGGRYRRAESLAAALGTAIAAKFWLDGFSWPLMERALPVLLAGLSIWSFAGFVVNWADDERRRMFAVRTGWCLFSLTLLAKIGLSARISQYGFVLAAPATVALVASLIEWLPAAADRRGWAGGAIRWLALPLVVTYVAAYQTYQNRIVDRSVPLGVGADRFDAAAFALPVADALATIADHVGAEETLAVFPEGVMLNYLSRREAPTKYITWMPPEVLFFGEASMLASLEESPPDWVLVAPRGLGEYGLGQFGSGFADSIARWIEANYATVDSWGVGQVIGDDDGLGSRRVWRLMRRKH